MTGSIDAGVGFSGREARESASPVIARVDFAEVLAFPGGASMTLLADALATDGRLSVHRTTLRNGADGANPHHHTVAAEVVYVLSGSVQVLTDREVQVLTAGDLAVVPPGLVHAFAAAPGSDAELLVAVTPGIARFDVFRRLARVASGATPDGLLDDQSADDTYNDDSPIWQVARNGTEAS